MPCSAATAIGVSCEAGGLRPLDVRVERLAERARAVAPDRARPGRGRGRRSTRLVRPAPPLETSVPCAPTASLVDAAGEHGPRPRRRARPAVPSRAQARTSRPASSAAKLVSEKLNASAASSDAATAAGRPGPRGAPLPGDEPGQRDDRERQVAAEDVGVAEQRVHAEVEVERVLGAQVGVEDEAARGVLDRCRSAASTAHRGGDREQHPAPEARASSRPRQEREERGERDVEEGGVLDRVLTSSE